MTLPRFSGRALKPVTLGLMLGAVVPALLTTACATTDSGVREPGRGLLDPATTTPGLAAGDHAPDGALRDPESQRVDLAALYADGPTVLIFYRGGWCPFCSRDLQNWQDALPEFESAGASVVAVSMESPEHALDTVEKNKLGYRVLVDETGETVKAFRLGFALDEGTKKRYEGFGIDLSTWNSNGSWELPAPAVYVIDTDGVIRYASADWDYRKRAGYEDALEVVRGL